MVVNRVVGVADRAASPDDDPVSAVIGNAVHSIRLTDQEVPVPANVWLVVTPCPVGDPVVVGGSGRWDEDCCGEGEGPAACASRPPWLSDCVRPGRAQSNPTRRGQITTTCGKLRGSGHAGLRSPACVGGPDRPPIPRRSGVAARRGPGRERIDMMGYARRGDLRIVDLEPDELTTFAELALRVDDGEAATLAVSVHRGWSVATDDRKAQRLARDLEPPIEPITTSAFLHGWASEQEEPAERVAEALRSSGWGPGRPRCCTPLAISGCCGATGWASWEGVPHRSCQSTTLRWPCSVPGPKRPTDRPNGLACISLHF